MDWQKQVAQLEKERNFDIAVFLLEKVIKENPNEVDAYLFLLFRLIDSIVENTRYWAVSNDSLRDIKQEYYGAKKDIYRDLLSYYFNKSYEQFSNNPEYLFYASGLLIPSYWFCGLDMLNDDFLDAMQKRAFNAHYNEILAQEYFYRQQAQDDPKNPEVLAYARELVSDVLLQKQLATKEALAKYIFGGTLQWAKDVLDASVTDN